MHNKIKHSIFWLLALCGLFLQSCIPHQELLNFTEGPEFQTQPKEISNQVKLTILPDDLLSISVLSLDLKAAAPFNLSKQISTGNSSGEVTPFDYLVDTEGYIDFPVLGKLKVAGLTIPETKSLIAEGVRTYLKNPIVNVKFSNFRVTILGEVNNPGTYFIPDEEISVLEALGLAGDLSDYGRRDSILIIREQNGIREFGNINMRSREVFQSPYFYMRQNDVIYVSSIKQKTSSIRSPARDILPWVTVGTSLALLIVNIVN